MVKNLAKYEGRCKICTLIPPCKHVENPVDSSSNVAGILPWTEHNSVETKSKISMKEEEPGLIQILDGVPAGHRRNS